MKYTFDRPIIGLDKAQERTPELMNVTVEYSKTEKQRRKKQTNKKHGGRVSKTWDNYKRYRVYVM